MERYDFSIETLRLLARIMPPIGAVIFACALPLSPRPIATAFWLALLFAWNGMCDKLAFAALARRSNADRFNGIVRVSFSVVALGFASHTFGVGSGWLALLPAMIAIPFTQPGCLRWGAPAALSLSVLLGHVAAGADRGSTMSLGLCLGGLSLVLPFLIRLFKGHWDAAQDAAVELRNANVALRERKRELEVLLIEARKAAMAKSAFLANMSHEVRTPLNGINGVIQLLATDDLGDEREELAKVAADSVGDLVRLLSDILDFSKAEAGRLVLERLPMVLGDELESVVALFAKEAADRGLTLSLERASDLPEQIIGDPTRLSQVVRNLLSNAIKFTESGGTIRVRAHYSAERLRIEVVDTGIGVDEAMEDRIFGVFEQADSSTTRRFGGTGLGLAICKELVELMHGEIGVDSTLGVGSTFWVELPIEEVDSDKPLPKVTPEPHVRTTSDGPPLRILVVEDNPVNQLVAARLLAQCACEVTCAGNGAEALDFLEGNRVDLVLMDCHMPKMDGFEATRRLREREADLAITRTPIVALSASTLAQDRAACERAGMDSFLSKPFALADIERLLITLGLREAAAEQE